MQDVELFLALAEIAGIFVGFGALIALRSGATADPAEVMFVGMVVWMGVQAVAGALAPVAISRFGVTGHALWLTCSVIVLALFWIGDELVKRLSPERRAILAAMPRKARARQELIGVPFWLPMNLALVLVVLGVAARPRGGALLRGAGPPAAVRRGPGPPRGDHRGGGLEGARQ